MNVNSFLVVFLFLLVSISPPTSLIYLLNFLVFSFWVLIFSYPKAVTTLKLSLYQGLKANITPENVGVIFDAVFLFMSIQRALAKKRTLLIKLNQSFVWMKIKAVINKTKSKSEFLQCLEFKLYQASFQQSLEFSLHRDKYCRFCHLIWQKES